MDPFPHRQRKRTRHGLTLGQYIRRRTGRTRSRGAIWNMVFRSLGANSFAGFWRYWNPIFGYYLSTRVYAPLLRIFAEPLALVATFVVCGAFHDLVTMAVRRAPAFFFTPWFFLLGLGVLFGRRARLDFSHRAWPVRASANLAYIGACLGLTLMAKRVFGFP